MNSLTFSGNLVRDCVVEKSDIFIKCVHFRIAQDRSYISGNGEKITRTLYLDCYIYKSQLAERLAPSLYSGRKVVVNGTLMTSEMLPDDKGFRHCLVIVDSIILA